MVVQSWSSKVAVVAAGLLLGAVSAARASDTLYAIGPDGGGVGRAFAAIAPAGSSALLGNGALAFNGGLAYAPTSAAFYAIDNDATGLSSLTSFQASAPATLASPVALGYGFLGGLAFDAADAQLYAIGSDGFGASSFYRVGSGGAALLGAIGIGFYGGLTYDAVDASFYAIGADASFVQRRVARIQIIGGAPVVTSLFDLGDGSIGFNGGIAYDAAASRFVVIGSDASGASSLYAFTASGAASLSSVQALGPGYVNVGLAFGPGAAVVVTSVPEPSTTALLGAGALLGLAVGRRRRRRASGTTTRVEAAGRPTTPGELPPRSTHRGIA